MAAVPESDPRVETARELFRHIDRIFPSARQFGWEHPATERALRTAFEAFAEALAKQPRVELSVRPYSLLAHGHTVWEPPPPFDAIPYNLFACGIRAINVSRGLGLEELRSLLGLLMTDPGRDLPPEDDLVSAFWERALEHVSCDVVDALAEGDASERETFYGQADEVEAMAAGGRAASERLLEAKAMALSTDRAALDRAKPRAPSPMGLDDVVRAVFSAQLEVSREKWSERYIDALIEGYLDAAGHRDAPLVLASLRKSAADLVVAGRLLLVVSLHEALVARLAHRVKGEDLARLSAALTNALFGAETLELSLGRLQKEPAEVERFTPILRGLWAAELPTVLAALATTPAGPLRDALTQLRRARPAGSRDGRRPVAPRNRPEPRRRSRRAPRPRGDSGGEAGARAARHQRRRHAEDRSQGAARVLGRPSAGGAHAAPGEQLGAHPHGGAARGHAALAEAGVARDRPAGARADVPRARRGREARAAPHARRARAGSRRADGHRAREEGRSVHIGGP